MDPIIITIVIAAAVLGAIFLPRLFRSGEGRDAPPPPPPKYNVWLFSGGPRAVKTWIATRYSTGDNKLFILPESSQEEWTIIAGTYIIERVEPPHNGERAAEGSRRYKVVLYSNSEVVREWTVHRYSTGDGKLFILPDGHEDWTIIAGTYTIEPTA